VEAILATLPGTVGVLSRGETYGPIVDGLALTTDLMGALGGSAADVPFLMGSNADEGTIFAAAYASLTAPAYEALVRSVYGEAAERVLDAYPAEAYDSPHLALADVTGDVGFVCPARRAARLQSAAGRPAFLYAFTHVTAAFERSGLGAAHGSEIPFVFGSLPLAGTERTLSDAMMQLWTSFATGGAPRAEEIVEWPEYRASEDLVLELKDDPAVVAGWRKEKCDLWDELAGASPAPTPTTPVPVPSPSPFAESLHLPHATRP
jgi:para-nitrobenzyl esterase